MGPVILAHASSRAGLAVARSLQSRGVAIEAVVDKPRQFATWSNAMRGHVHAAPNPRAEPEKFAALVAGLADETGAAGVLPVSDEALGALGPSREQLPEGVVLMTAASDATRVVLDKHATATLAQRLRIPVPPTAPVRSIDDLESAAAELGYPVILKRPDQGRALPRTLKRFTVEQVANRDELRKWAEIFDTAGVIPVLQKIVPGKMHNVCCFAAAGEIVAAHEYESIRRGKHAGIARRIVVADDTRLEYARRFLGALAWDGVAALSFLVDDAEGRNWYLETNGRFWASVEASVVWGWDFPAWTVDWFLSRKRPTPPAIPDSSPIVSYRTAELERLVEILRTGSWFPEGRPVTRGQAVLAYLRSFGPGYRSDVFRWSDPLPSIVDHASLISGYFRGARRRLSRLT